MLEVLHHYYLFIVMITLLLQSEIMFEIYWDSLTITQAQSEREKFIWHDFEASFLFFSSPDVDLLIISCFAAFSHYWISRFLVHPFYCDLDTSTQSLSQWMSKNLILTFSFSKRILLFAELIGEVWVGTEYQK